MLYKEFLKTKALETIQAGFDVDRSTLNKNLFQFQADLVVWALKKGKAAIYADCGCGKTICELEFAEQINRNMGGRQLIVAPLAVVGQTKREGEKFGYTTNICRTQGDVRDGINIINYEMLDHINANDFNTVILDESSCIKSFTSALRNMMIDKFGRTPYKLLCSATPAPNDSVEHGNASEFLGIETRTEMLAEYFIHDGSNTSSWRLKGHGEKKFWEWMATWAVCMRNPSDLGYSADGYILPNLHIIKKIVESKPGDYELIVRRAETLAERREARKESMPDRVAVAKELVESNDEQWIVWCDYNAESTALAKAIKDSVEVVGADSPEFKAETAIKFANGEIRVLVSKCSIYGQGMNFQNCHNIIYCGISDSFESFYQSIRRCWRYGQEHEVYAYIITSEKEMNVLENIERKQALMDTMQDNMIALMHDVTMSEIKKTTRITDEYHGIKIELPHWLKGDNDG